MWNAWLRDRILSENGLGLELSRTRIKEYTNLDTMWCPRLLRHIQALCLLRQVGRYVRA